MARKTRRQTRRKLTSRRLSGGRGGAGGLGGASVGHADMGGRGGVDFGSVDNRTGTLPVNQQQTQGTPASVSQDGSDMLTQLYNKTLGLLKGGSKKRRTLRKKRTLRNKRRSLRNKRSLRN
jgi:hypothetical protein